MIVLASVFFYLKWFASALQVVKRCHIYVTHLQTTLLITTNCVGVSYSFFVEEPIDGDIELHLILTFFLSFVFSLQYLMEDWFVDFMVSNILETTMFIISAFLVNIYKNFAKREILLKYLHKNYLILTELRFDCVVYIVWNIKQHFLHRCFLLLFLNQKYIFVLEKLNKLFHTDFSDLETEDLSMMRSVVAKWQYFKFWTSRIPILRVCIYDHFCGCHSTLTHYINRLLRKQ